MGYSTNFRVEIYPKQHEAWEKDKTGSAWSMFIIRMKRHWNEIIAYGIEVDDDEQWEIGDAKWYDHGKDLENISKEFPEIIFRLSGEGEGDGSGADGVDIWDSVYHNGEEVAKEYAKVIAPNVYPSIMKLQER